MTLRELAQAATPGPWFDDSYGTIFGGQRWETEDDFGYERIAGIVDGEFKGLPNARYIAACSPDAILALLDRLDAAQEALRLADAALLAFWEFVDQPSSCHLPRPTWPKEHKEAAAAARARQEEP